MTKYVYMLSDYGEYGSQNCMATLDRGKLYEMCGVRWPHEHVINGLRGVLERSDEDLDDGSGHNLTEVWGGPQLHVIKLV